VEGETTDMKIDSKDFVLSQALHGHGDGIRCIAVQNDSSFVTGSSKSEFICWTRQDDGSFAGKTLFQQKIHENAFCMQYVADDEYISGGTTYIGEGELIHWKTNGEVLNRIPHPGKSAAVNSCSVRPGTKITCTGCFDEKARMFSLLSPDAQQVLAGHKYGVEVLFLDDCLITGSYENLLIFSLDGKLVKKVAMAHNHQIKRIVPHPLGFATCSNDGFVKIWTKQGDQLQSICAHPETQKHASFVYSLSALPDGRLATSGEDQNVKIWNSDGSISQSIKMPAAVRDLICLPNGDLITGSTDMQVRIWSCDPNRRGSDELIANFHEFVQMSGSSMKELDESNLADPSILEEPGEEGQFAVVRTADGPMAYQYSGGQWVVIGHAMGSAEQASDHSGTLNGIQYDCVLQVDVDGNYVKIAFNKDDDPKKVTRNFCQKHSLVEEFARMKVLKFIEPHIDPQARAARMEREAIARQNALRHTPINRYYKAHIFSESKLDKMEDAVVNNNKAQADLPSYVDPKDLDQIFKIVKDTSHYHSSEFPRRCIKTVQKILCSPTKYILPILDFCRILMLHHEGVTALDSKEVRTAILNHFESAEFGRVQMRLLCELLANYLNKRNPDHKSDPEVLDFLRIVVQQTTPLCAESKVSFLRAYTAFHTNLLIWMARFHVPVDRIIKDEMDSLAKAAVNIKKGKWVFFTFLNLATTAYLGKSERPYLLGLLGGEESLKALVGERLNAADVHNQTDSASKDLFKIFK